MLQQPEAVHTVIAYSYSSYELREQLLTLYGVRGCGCSNNGLADTGLEATRRIGLPLNFFCSSKRYVAVL